MIDMNFSVSMCVYGKDDPDHFKTAVDSIIHQSLMPSEVVIVVDGPVPEELDCILSEYEKNSVFNIVRLAENKGHGIARQTGLQNCKYDLVALMDADDISAPDRFEKQIVAFRTHPEVSIVGGNIQEFIDTPENIIGCRIVPQQDAEIKEYMKNRCPMNQMTVMFKADDVYRAGGYIDWYCDEDYYLWLRMYLKGMKFYNCNDILVKVRCGADMYQRRGGMKYFKSERKLQQFMLSQHIIPRTTYCMNVTKRFILQVMLPNSVRGWVFQKFARKNI